MENSKNYYTYQGNLQKKESTMKPNLKTYTHYCGKQQLRLLFKSMYNLIFSKTINRFISKNFDWIWLFLLFFKHLDFVKEKKHRTYWKEF